MQAEDKSLLFEINAANKKHEIWQRDSLGIEIYSRAVAKQKLDYIHFNPVSGKWQLAKNDIIYYYSSANFYETGVDDFGFLKNRTVFLMANDYGVDYGGGFVRHEPRRSFTKSVNIEI